MTIKNVLKITYNIMNDNKNNNYKKERNIRYNQ